MMNEESLTLLAEVRKARTAACMHWAPILPAEPEAVKDESPVNATTDSVQLSSPINSMDSVDPVLTGIVPQTA